MLSFGAPAAGRGVLAESLPHQASLNARNSSQLWLPLSETLISFQLFAARSFYSAFLLLLLFSSFSLSRTRNFPVAAAVAGTQLLILYSCVQREVFFRGRIAIFVGPN